MSDIVERLEGTKHGLYWDVARDAIAEITRLRTLLSEAVQREQKLQASLSFWMPGVTEEIENSTDGRCGDDANLLVGYDGPFEDKCWGDEIIARGKDVRAKALEEAAKVAEDEDGHFTIWGEDRNTRTSQKTARDIAAAIRALQSEGR